jgi:6-phosphofructokinase 1
VVVPETLSTATGERLGGDEPEYVDSFGHPYFPGAGSALTRLVTQALGVRARYDKPGTAARMSMSMSSDIDLEEAYSLGAAAVERVVAGDTGVATILRRTSDDPYACVVEVVPIERIANRVRPLPDAFIAANDLGITDDFRRYALPLLGTEPFPPYQRFRGERQDK